MKELKDVLGMVAGVLKSFAEGMDEVAGKVEALARANGDAEIKSDEPKQKAVNLKTGNKSKTRQPATRKKKSVVQAPVKKQVTKTVLKIVPQKKVAVKRPVRKSSIKVAPEKTEAGTASDTVLQLISGTINGIDTGAIMEKSGFDKKKVSNILHRLKQQGKIETAKRGIYTKKG